MSQILSKFETEELLAEILEWWHDIECKIPKGETVTKPRFIRLAERFTQRLPGTGPCQRGKK